VVHCYPPGSLTDLGFSSPGELAAASAVLLEDEVQAALEEMPQTPAVTKSSVIGSPAQVLVQRTSGASLLVIGVHRQTDLSDLILGRVGRQCLRHARSPVVVVGPDPDAVRYETPSPTKTSVL
jgi:nucleotide-binding universal stress UspA family protein